MESELYPSGHGMMMEVRGGDRFERCPKGCMGLATDPNTCSTCRGIGYYVAYPAERSTKCILKWVSGRLEIFSFEHSL